MKSNIEIIADRLSQYADKASTHSKHVAAIIQGNSLLNIRACQAGYHAEIYTASKSCEKGGYPQET